MVEDVDFFDIMCDLQLYRVSIWATYLTPKSRMIFLVSSATLENPV